MRPYKQYIDNEIVVTMAQMDKPSKIFDYLYLVSFYFFHFLSTKLHFAVTKRGVVFLKLKEVRFRQDVVM